MHNRCILRWTSDYDVHPISIARTKLSLQSYKERTGKQNPLQVHDYNKSKVANPVAIAEQKVSFLPDHPMPSLPSLPSMKNAGII